VIRPVKGALSTHSVVLAGLPTEPDSTILGESISRRGNK